MPGEVRGLGRVLFPDKVWILSEMWVLGEMGSQERWVSKERWGSWVRSGSQEMWGSIALGIPNHALYRGKAGISDLSAPMGNCGWASAPFWDSSQSNLPVLGEAEGNRKDTRSFSRDQIPAAKSTSPGYH